MPKNNDPMSSPPSLTSTIIQVQGEMEQSPTQKSASLMQEKQESSSISSLPPTSEGQMESALPEDKIEEAYESKEEDWGSDPMNARNWPSGKKWRAVGVISLYTFVAPLASSMVAPGLPEIAKQYNITNSTEVAMTLSIFLLSLAISPLILAPLSEMYGRTWVLHIGNILTAVFNLACGFAPNKGTLIGLRFLVGASAAASITCGFGTIGDLFSDRDRASAMALYNLGPLFGPIIGPIAGGFISQDIGIKWVFYILACVGFFASLVGIPTLEETYGPILRRRRDEKLGLDLETAAKRHPHLSAAHEKSPMKFLWENLSRPIIMLSKSLICFVLSLYMAFMYGIYYLLFATFADLFAGTYGFKPGMGGLVYMGLGVGFVSASIFGARFANTIYRKQAEKNGGKGTPEMRIPALFFGSFFVPIGLFWYGWSAQAKIHWIMPIIGSGIFGFGMMSTFLPISLYLVDTFAYAASANAAASFFRSLLGFAFPLFGKQMFDAMGLGGGYSLLAGLAILLGIPFPAWLYYHGAEMRARNPLTRAGGS